jgi:hypothetical protein
MISSPSIIAKATLFYGFSVSSAVDLSIFRAVHTGKSIIANTVSILDYDFALQRSNSAFKLL